MKQIRTDPEFTNSITPKAKLSNTGDLCCSKATPNLEHGKNLHLLSKTGAALTVKFSAYNLDHHFPSQKINDTPSACSTSTDPADTGAPNKELLKALRHLSPSSQAEGRSHPLLPDQLAGRSHFQRRNNLTELHILQQSPKWGQAGSKIGCGAAKILLGSPMEKLPARRPNGAVAWAYSQVSVTTAFSGIHWGGAFGKDKQHLSFHISSFLLRCLGLIYYTEELHTKLYILCFNCISVSKVAAVQSHRAIHLPASVLRNVLYSYTAKESCSDKQLTQASFPSPS